MMVIDGADPFATAKPDPPLSKLLTRARRFNTTLIGSDGVPFAAPAERESVSPSYFTRLVRLSDLARTSSKPSSTAASRAIWRRHGTSSGPCSAFLELQNCYVF
jgi:hypothetical protein